MALFKHRDASNAHQPQLGFLRMCRAALAAPWRLARWLGFQLLRQLGRTLSAVALGHPRGLVVNLATAVVLVVVGLDLGTGILQSLAERAMLPAAGDAETVRSPHADPANVQSIERNVGKCWIPTLPLAGSDSTLDRAVGDGVARRLLARYTFSKTPETAETAKPSPTESSTGNVSNLAQGAGDQVGDGSLDLSASPPPYQTGHMIVEVYQQFEGDAVAMKVAVAYQHAPGQWREIPWWRTNNIAATNTLLRIQRHPLLPFLRKASSDTTVTAFLSYLSTNWRKETKALNRDYGIVPSLKLDTAEFRQSVAGELDRSLTEDFGDVSGKVATFTILTISGELQALTFLCLAGILVALAARVILLRVVPGGYWLLLLAARRFTPSQLASLADRLGNWHQSVFGVSCPWPQPLAASLRRGKPASRTALESIRKSWHSLRYQSRFLIELGSTCVFWGFVGSLLFLSLTLGAIRLSDDFGKTASFIAHASQLNMQAFLTTLTAACCHRLACWCQFLELAAEMRAEEADVSRVATLAAWNGDENSRPRLARPLANAAAAVRRAWTAASATAAYLATCLATAYGWTWAYVRYRIGLGPRPQSRLGARRWIVSGLAAVILMLVVTSMAFAMMEHLDRDDAVQHQRVSFGALVPEKGLETPVVTRAATISGCLRGAQGSWRGVRGIICPIDELGPTAASRHHVAAPQSSGGATVTETSMKLALNDPWWSTNRNQDPVRSAIRNAHVVHWLDVIKRTLARNSKLSGATLMPKTRDDLAFELRRDYVNFHRMFTKLSGNLDSNRETMATVADTLAISVCLGVEPSEFTPPICWVLGEATWQLVGEENLVGKQQCRRYVAYRLATLFDRQQQEMHFAGKLDGDTLAHLSHGRAPAWGGCLAAGLVEACMGASVGELKDDVLEVARRLEPTLQAIEERQVAR